MARILYVEDNQENQELVRRSLATLGHEYLVALDGPSGYQMALVHQPDLILMDINLPGEDGYSVITRLLASPEFRLVPIVMLLASAGHGDREWRPFMRLPYLRKPLSIEDFLDRLPDFLTQGATHPAPEPRLDDLRLYPLPLSDEAWASVQARLPLGTARVPPGKQLFVEYWEPLHPWQADYGRFVRGRVQERLALEEERAHPGVPPPLVGVLRQGRPSLRSYIELQPIRTLPYLLGEPFPLHSFIHAVDEDGTLVLVVAGKPYSLAPGQSWAQPEATPSAPRTLTNYGWSEASALSIALRPTEVSPPAAHTARLAYSATQGRLFLAEPEGISLFAISPLRHLTRWPTTACITLAVSPDGSTLASSHEGGLIQVWDIASGQPGVSLYGEGENLWSSLAFHPLQPWLLAGSTEGLIQVWDIQRGTRRGVVWRDGMRAIHRLCFSPDGTSLLVAEDSPILRLWSVETGQLVRKLLHLAEGHPPLCAAQVQSDGTLLSASRDGTVCTWDGRTGRVQQRWTFKEYDLQAMAFPPHGTAVAAGLRDGALRLWPDGPGSRAQRWCLDQGWALRANSLLWSPDGRWLAVYGTSGLEPDSSRNTLGVLELETGELQQLRHNGPQVRLWTAPPVEPCPVFVPAPGQPEERATPFHALRAAKGESLQILGGRKLGALILLFYQYTHPSGEQASGHTFAAYDERFGWHTGNGMESWGRRSGPAVPKPAPPLTTGWFSTGGGRFPGYYLHGRVLLPGVVYVEALLPSGELRRDEVQDGLYVIVTSVDEGNVQELRLLDEEGRVLYTHRVQAFMH